MLCLIVLISVLPVFAQTASEEKIAYLDKNYSPVTDPKAATYYRTLQTNDGGYIVRNYFMSGQVQMIAVCSEFTPNVIRHGEVKYFYENGNLHEQGMYRKNMRDGEFAYYYENGKLEQRIMHDGFKDHYLEYYTPGGRQVVTDGVGMLTDTDDAGDTIYSQVDNYDIVSCYKVALMAPGSPS
jgi:antitoxin component YwqK of YwqJK toxin-antitoxin module